MYIRIKKKYLNASQDSQREIVNAGFNKSNINKPFRKWFLLKTVKYIWKTVKYI